MKAKGILRGQTIELLAPIEGIPDGTELVLTLEAEFPIDREARLANIRDVLQNWDEDAKADFLQAMAEVEGDRRKAYEAAQRSTVD
ncbi:hypothetical protein HC928_16535 [bacterium]|nr:hypothetical protein [bacterium]